MAAGKVKIANPLARSLARRPARLGWPAKQGRQLESGSQTSVRSFSSCCWT